MVSFSVLGLGLSAFPVTVHGLLAPEALFPMAARNIVTYIFHGAYNFRLSPPAEEILTLQDQESMLQAAISSLPSEKWAAAQDYVFVLTIEQRQSSTLFIACALGSLYAASLPAADRYPLHVLYTIVALFMAYTNANHFGCGLQGNPMVTPNGRLTGMLFLPFWLLCAFCNYKGYLECLAKA
jgi:hypothetical protein